jgi:2,3-bisphosphoglycerate-dependent phosphoglycerate mutase
MQFYFIRHAQSENNQRWLETGSHHGRDSDPPLTTLGWRQAGRLARFLEQPVTELGDFGMDYDPQNVLGFGITHIYCSLMVRSVATGTVLAQAFGLPLVAWEDIHEVGGIHTRDEETGDRTGQPGKNRAYFEEHYPGLVLPEGLGEEGWWNRPFETREERPLRAKRVLDELRGRHGDTDHHVAIISHGGFYNHLMRILLDLRQEGVPWFSLNNTAMTRIDFEEQATWIQFTNRADHLPREMIT